MAHQKIAKYLDPYLIRDVRDIVQKYSPLEFVYSITKDYFEENFGEYINWFNLETVVNDALPIFERKIEEIRERYADGGRIPITQLRLGSDDFIEEMDVILPGSQLRVSSFLYFYPFFILLQRAYNQSCNVNEIIGLLDAKYTMRLAKYALGEEY